MPQIRRPLALEWTLHAQVKMRHYRLSQARVRRVLHAPRRTEEGIAPNTVAVMQPSSLKGKDRWTQEIWVMVSDGPKARRVVSAWRYPGITKPRSPAVLAAIRREYDDAKEQGAQNE